jgi:hypothetical protein
VAIGEGLHSTGESTSSGDLKPTTQ